jgi:hypothetical protein
MVNAFCRTVFLRPVIQTHSRKSVCGAADGIRFPLFVLSCVFSCLPYFDITRIIQSVICLFQLFAKYNKSERRCCCSSNFRLKVAKGSSVHFRHIFVELTGHKGAKMPLERRLKGAPCIFDTSSLNLRATKTLKCRSSEG